MDIDANDKNFCGNVMYDINFITNKIQISLSVDDLDGSSFNVYISRFSVQYDGNLMTDSDDKIEKYLAHNAYVLCYPRFIDSIEAGLEGLE
jgi:hypothetical protein